MGCIPVSYSEMCLDNIVTHHQHDTRPRDSHLFSAPHRPHSDSGAMNHNASLHQPQHPIPAMWARRPGTIFATRYQFETAVMIRMREEASPILRADNARRSLTSEARSETERTTTDSCATALGAVRLKHPHCRHCSGTPTVGVSLISLISDRSSFIAKPKRAGAERSHRAAAPIRHNSRLLADLLLCCLADCLKKQTHRCLSSEALREAGPVRRCFRRAGLPSAPCSCFL